MERFLYTTHEGGTWIPGITLLSKEQIRKQCIINATCVPKICTCIKDNNDDHLDRAQFKIVFFSMMLDDGTLFDSLLHIETVLGNFMDQSLYGFHKDEVSGITSETFEDIWGNKCEEVQA